MMLPPCPRSESAYDFLNGRMTEAERSAFEEHLEQCAPCRAEVEALRETVGHLDAWSPPEVSPGFAQKILAEIGGPRPRLADRLRAWLPVRPLPLTVGAVVAAGLVVVVLGVFPQILSDSALRRERRAVTTAGLPSPPPSTTPRDIVPRPAAKPAAEKVKPAPKTGRRLAGRVTRAPRRPALGARPTTRSGEGAPSPPAKQPALKTIMPYRVHRTPPPRSTRSTLARRKRRFRRPAVRPSPEPKRRAVTKKVLPPKAPERSVRPRTGTPDRPDRAGPARQKPPPPSPAPATQVARRARPPVAEVRQAPGGQPRGKALLGATADRRAMPQNMAMVLSLVERYHGRVIKPSRRTSKGIVLKVVIPIPQRKVFLIRLNGLKRHGIRRVDESLAPINILVTTLPPRTR